LEGVELSRAWVEWGFDSEIIRGVATGGFDAGFVGVEYVSEAEPVADFVNESGSCAEAVGSASEGDSGKGVNIDEAAVMEYVRRRRRKLAVAVGSRTSTIDAPGVVDLLDNVNVNVFIASLSQLPHNFILIGLFV